MDALSLSLSIYIYIYIYIYIREFQTAQTAVRRNTHRSSTDVLSFQYLKQNEKRRVQKI